MFVKIPHQVTTKPQIAPTPSDLLPGPVKEQPGLPDSEAVWPLLPLPDTPL